MSTITKTIVDSPTEKLELSYSTFSGPIRWKTCTLIRPDEEGSTVFAANKIWVNGQPLFYLQDGGLLSEEASYKLVEIQEESQELILELENQAMIKLTIVDGENAHPISSSPELTGLGLKKQIQREFSLPSGSFNLLSDPNTALDDKYTLRENQVDEGATLTLLREVDPFQVIDLENEGSFFLESYTIPFPFIDPEHDYRVLLDVDLNASPWCHIIAGLNLYGKCTPCAKEVVIPVGISSSFFYKNSAFSIGEERYQSQCPTCKGSVEDVFNLILWSCKYTIEGRRSNEDNSISTQEGEVQSGEKPITYRSQGNIPNWDYLKIKTEGLSFFSRCQIL